MSGKVQSSNRTTTTRRQSDLSLSEEAVFDMLGNSRRRRVVDVVEQANGAVGLGELAERIAARENDVSVDQVTARERKRVYTTLQQTHLPKMERAGVLTFERDDGRVSPADEFTECSFYLELVSSNAIGWNAYYLRLSALGMGVALAVWFGLPPLTALPALAWAAMFVALFGLSALARLYSDRRRRAEKRSEKAIEDRYRENANT